MAKNYFIANSKQDLENIAKQLILWFKEKQYEVDSTEANGRYFIQAKKTGVIRTVLGTNLAFQVKIFWSKNPTVVNEFTVETSTGKWITNLAGAGVTALFIGGFTILTGLAGAGWALIIENDIIGYVETGLKFQKVKKFEDVEPEISVKPHSSTAQSSYSEIHKKALEKVAQDLKKLELAFENGILTEAEFEVKKTVLQDRIDEYEIEFSVEEKIAKFQKAFSEGILSADEYEDKVRTVEEVVKYQIFQERHEKQKAIKIAKLKEAWENGILTEEEYQSKVAAL